MNEESDSYLTKENYRGTLEASDFHEKYSQPGSLSHEQSIHFASNPFEAEYSNTSFQLKKMKISKDTINPVEKEKNKSVEKIWTDPESSKSSAIDALEQFKCQVRSRQKFTNPLGTSRASAPKIYNTEISQLLSFNKKEEKPKTRTRKRKEDDPIVEIPKEYSVSFGQKDIIETKEAKKSPSKEARKSPGKESAESKIESNDFEEKIPDWAQKENARDAKGRSQDDPDYDPHTLWIPPNALDGCTPLVKKYWEIKSQHFDEILLFQVGDFYRISYEDAVICHQELNLNWLGNKVVVGVHWKSFDKCVEILILKGYKVCVVEQSENYKGKKTRLKDTTNENKEKTIKRDVSQVLSKGTFIDYNNPNYEPRYLMSLRINSFKVAVTFLEIGYSVITFGYFDDDESFTSLKTLISQIKPTEVIYDRTSIDHNIIRYLRYLPGGPILTPCSQIKAWSSLKLAEELEKFYGALGEWPQALQEILLIDTSQKEMLLLSYIGILEYLEKALISDQVLYTARYELYDPESFKQGRMILDSQALSNLEVFEVNYSTKSSFEGSLLSYIDKTSTRYGKRLLKNWICGPLLDVVAINQRLDAIEDLELNLGNERKDKIPIEEITRL